MKKQFEIIHSKPLKERVENMFEMTELSRKIIQNRIRLKTPDISEIELKIETFKTFYRQDFDNETLEQVISSMRCYLERNRNTSSI